ERGRQEAGALSLHAAAAVLAVFAIQVDHDVRDRNREALARVLDDAALEPVRAALRMRGDDDLVRPERPERVLDRLQRIAVADLAARLHARLRQLRKAPVEAFLCGRTS